MIKINGSAIPAPTVFQWDKSDLDSESSGRAADGTMHRDRIGSKIKLSLEWKFLSSGEMAQILNAVSDVFFSVTYPDAQAGTNKTLTFYVGDRSAPLYVVENGIAGWSGLSMNFIEK